MEAGTSAQGTDDDLPTGTDVFYDRVINDFENALMCW